MSGTTSTTTTTSCGGSAGDASPGSMPGSTAFCSPPSHQVPGGRMVDHCGRGPLAGRDLRAGRADDRRRGARELRCPRSEWPHLGAAPVRHGQATWLRSAGSGCSARPSTSSRGPAQCSPSGILLAVVYGNRGWTPPTRSRRSRVHLGRSASGWGWVSGRPDYESPRPNRSSTTAHAAVAATRTDHRHCRSIVARPADAQLGATPTARPISRREGDHRRSPIAMVIGQSLIALRNGE